jgi:CheY-like chemotaxis protein
MDVWIVRLSCQRRSLESPSSNERRPRLSLIHSHSIQGSPEDIGPRVNSVELRCTACLILDVRMPGIGGPKLQRRLAAENIHTPIIFIKAHGDQEVSAEVLKSAATALLRKPFNQESPNSIALRSRPIPRINWRSNSRLERFRLRWSHSYAVKDVSHSPSLAKRGWGGPHFF